MQCKLIGFDLTFVFIFFIPLPPQLSIKYLGMTPEEIVASFDQE